jgi:ABC-type multidrug transport system fused ATPase/permease subunit
MIDIDNDKNNTSSFLIFKELFINFKKGFFVLFILVLAEGFLAGLSVIAIIPLSDYLIDPSLEKASKLTLIVKDYIISTGIKPSFLIFGLIFFLINFIKGTFEVWIRYLVLKIKYGLLRIIYNDLLENLFNSRWEYFTRIKSGSLLNTLGRELPIIGDTLGHITLLLAQSVQLIIYFSIPFFINAQMTIIVILFSLAFFVVILFLNRISFRLGKKNMDTANKTFSFLNEVLSAIKLVFSYYTQNKSKNKYLEYFDLHADVTLKSQTLSIFVSKIFLPLSLLSVIISVAYAISNGVALSQAAAVMWSLLLAVPILNSLFQSSISLKNFIPSYNQVRQFNHDSKNYPENKGILHFDKLKDSISLENVSFTYPNRDQTLKSIDLKIKKNTITGLVGESGSGKSTILDLILSLQKPSSGRVILDENDITAIDVESYRKKIGIVFQEPFLLEMSIKENLKWFSNNRNFTDEEIYSALEISNCNEFINNLPNKMDTVIGERGSSLSGGQKQRIALARALIRKPEILILDEPTSALDLESEKFIINSLNKISGSMTIIIVTHKLSILKNIENIYFLSDGRITENGSYKDLTSNKNSKFSKFLNLN